MADRLAGVATGALVGHGAAADDGARAEGAGLGGVGHEVCEAEGRVHSSVGTAEGLAVVVDHKRQMDHVAAPCLAQLVRRNRHGAEGAGGFGLKEAEALGELAGDEAPQAHIIDQHQQLDVLRRVRLGDAHRHIVGDAGDLALHVHAPGRIAQRNVLARGEEAVAAALVHQRIMVEALGHLGAARLADQLDVVDVGAPVGPLIGAGEGA